MKQFSFLLASFLLATLASTQKSQAQSAIDAIDWSKYATTVDKVVSETGSTPTYVLLYNKTAATTVGASNAFLTNGGDYGMSGTLSPIGNSFTITKPADTFTATNVYRVQSNMTNTSQGGAFFSIALTTDATALYMDRGPKDNDADGKVSKPNWQFVYNQTSNSYQLVNATVTTARVFYNASTGFINYTLSGNTAQTADEWYIITAESYNNAINALGRNQYIEVSGLLKDARFDRLNDDVTYWKASTETKDITEEMGVLSGDIPGIYKYYNHLIGGSVFESHLYDKTDWRTSPWLFTSAYGKDYCAGIWTNGSYTNKVEGLPVGTYRILCSAFNTGTSLRSASFLVNGHKVPLPLLTDHADFTNHKNAVEADAAKKLKTSTDTTMQWADIIAAGQLLDSLADKYTVECYVEITAADVSSGKNYIEYGFSNDYPDGTIQAVYADNFRLFYTNPDYVAYLSANNATEADLDKYAYERPVGLYLRRDLTAGAWNAIVLPFDISLSNLVGTFGDDVQLSALEGINPDRTSQIRFVSTSSLKAGTIGLLYVPEGMEPDFAYASGSKKELKVLSAAITDIDNVSTTTKSISGPLYRLIGVTRSGDTSGKASFASTVSGTCTTSAGTLSYAGYYYKPKTGGKDTPWPKNSYIVESGKMYHLTSDWGAIRGTMWQLQNANASEAKVFTLEIDGFVDDDTTLIEGVVKSRQSVTPTAYYNISGQRIRQPHGLTIVRQADGTAHKIVVR